MKLYAIHTEQGADGEPTTVWTGSQSEAATARKNLLAQGSKRAELRTYLVDVPTDKVGLLQFLNDYAAGTKVMVATRKLTTE